MSYINVKEGLTSKKKSCSYRQWVDDAVNQKEAGQNVRHPRQRIAQGWATGLHTERSDNHFPFPQFHISLVPNWSTTRWKSAPQTSSCLSSISFYVNMIFSFFSYRGLTPWRFHEFSSSSFHVIFGGFWRKNFTEWWFFPWNGQGQRNLDGWAVWTFNSLPICRLHWGWGDFCLVQMRPVELKTVLWGPTGRRCLALAGRSAGRRKIK